MIDIISGIVVILPFMLLIYSVSRLIFVKNINIHINDSELKQYKTRILKINIIGTVIFLSISIFTYFFNCEFLTVSDRIDVIKNFISFFAIYFLVIWISNKNLKINIKKENLNIKKEKILIKCMEIICIISNVLLYIINNI